MIQVTTQRTRDGEVFDPLVTERTLIKALDLLVTCELGFGGMVEDLTPTRIQVRTHVWGCNDTTIIEGDEKQMELLVHIAAQHLSLMVNEADKVAKMAVKKSEEMLPPKLHGHPGTLATLAPLLIGAGPTKAALLAGLVQLNHMTMAGAKRAMSLSLNDLFAAVELSFEAGVQVDEVCAQLGVS